MAERKSHIYKTDYSGPGTASRSYVTGDAERLRDGFCNSPSQAAAADSTWKPAVRAPSAANAHRAWPPRRRLGATKWCCATPWPCRTATSPWTPRCPSQSSTTWRRPRGACTRSGSSRACFESEDACSSPSGRSSRLTERCVPGGPFPWHVSRSHGSSASATIRGQSVPFCAVGARNDSALLERLLRIELE